MKMWKILFYGGVLLLNSSLNAQDYVLQKLDGFISSNEYHEIAPCITSDGKTLYFTRLAYPKFERTLMDSGQDLSVELKSDAYFRRMASIYSILNGSPVVDPVNSEFNQDIWIAHSVNNEFDILEHPGYPLNNALPNSVCALTPSDQPIVLNQFVPEGGMQKGFSLVPKTESGEWAFPEAIGVDQYHNSGADVNLTMSSDGQVMIISMEREDSYGKADMFISFKQTDGTWSYPENLGRGINSPYRESAPHLSQDMKTLYFSSDRSYPGRGCDIYVQERLSDNWKDWTSPRKFRSPINSSGDDSHPFFNEATGYLYFTSDREGTSDIFRIQIKEPKTPKTPEPETPLAVQQDLIPLTIGSKIDFSNIYFLQSQAQILKKSYNDLHKLSIILKNNPNLVIRIAGHTDNIGDPDLLLKLSEERAEAIKGFLVNKKKIDPARIQTVGHGASKPLNDNSTEKLRKRNRRVEIEVIRNQKVVDTNLGTR